MLDNTKSTGETYETTIDNTTFQVITKYTGKKSFLDFIKTAIKRDVEMSLQNDKKEFDF